jgi:lipopolysaccharide export LptBFGC system permease protein LptF
MTFARYFLTRFFLATFSINLGLTLLFNLIEFFEKMIRVHESITVIAQFILLNLLPSFFENLLLSSWLGSCLVIREMYQQNEWEILQLIHVRLRKIFMLIIGAGSLLVFSSFVAQNFFVHTLAQRATQIKQERFKQQHIEEIFNQWFTLKDNVFCHIKYLNSDKKRGEELSILELSPTFIITKITSISEFFLKPNTQEIVVVKGSTLNPQTQEQKEILPHTPLLLPSFFTQISMHQTTPTLHRILYTLMSESSTLPSPLFSHLVALCLTHIFDYLLLILLPLLTFVLFFTFPYHRYARWILIFIPYPLIKILSFGPALLAHLVTLTLTIFLLFYTIRK